MESDNSEKYCSAKTVLSTILLNSDTTEILDEYIVSYLKSNPSLVTKYINQNGLYNVYIRSILYGTLLDNYFGGEIDFLKSFATELEAKNWITENGYGIIEKSEKIFDRCYYLMIVHERDLTICENHDKKCLCFSHHYNVINKKYPTFAFCQYSYDALVNETKMFMEDKILDKDLTWITRVKI